jgi:ubiquilin
MTNNPQFLQQMSTMMANPAILDQVIAMNPQLQAVAPQVRAAFQSPQFREMMYAHPLPVIPYQKPVFPQQ